METYLVVRRSGWRTTDELRDAAERSTAEGERMADDVCWIRSYVLAETDGSLGTVCIHQASSPEAIRRHAYAATLPVDEIVAVPDTLVITYTAEARTSAPPDVRPKRSAGFDCRRL